MAIKYYGTCSGNAGSKYNIWLEVTENSYNITNNTSNLTLKLFLKRNDGYANSAYNLNENDNFAKITINDNVKVNRNLEIDTRNSVTVTLASWTGNVAHNADGRLTVDVGGSFGITGTSLAGGSVTGSFNCVTIPRTSSFSLNKSNVQPNESIEISILSATSVFSHQIIYELGDYKNTINLSAGVVNSSFSIPNSWVNAIPKARQGTVSVTVKTYNSSTLIGSNVSFFTLNIPETDEFLPDFNTSIIFDNGDMPVDWNVVLQNISTATIKIESETAKYGSQIVSTYITVGNLKKECSETSVAFQEAGEISVISRVTDTRGFSKEKSEKIFVTAYSRPTISFDKIYRCDSAGNPLTNGSYARIEFTPQVSAVNNLNESTVRLKYKKGNENQSSDYIAVTTTPVIVNGNFLEASSYDFILEITDKITQAPFTVERVLPSGNIPFNIKSGGKGAAFGCYSERDNELTIGYDLNVVGVIKFNDLSDTALLNAAFQKSFLEIKNFSCLGLTTIKSGLISASDIPLNTWVKVFQITNAIPPMEVPLEVITGDIEIDKNIKAYINKTGEVFLSTATTIDVGRSIFISGIY